MRRKIINFGISGGLFITFIIFTLMVKNIDVKAIGPNESLVGFATINLYVANHVGKNMIWYNITDWMGVIPIVFALIYSAIGLTQLIKRRSIRKVDFEILTLGLFYVIVIAFYAVFELVIINYRPILINGYLEASYPSSHTLITICIMATGVIFNNQALKNKKLKIGLNIMAILIIAITVIGRFISGVHWISDITAGIILSASLVMLYYSVARLQSDVR